jgi:hypothetical protein
MFLFVIMLAQQGGAERHDRFARQPSLSTATSVVLLSLILSAIAVTYHGSLAGQRPEPRQAPGIRPAEVWDLRPESQHVASLGRALFTEHWLSIELAGTLLLAAMVGAIVIAAVRRPDSGAPTTGSGAPTLDSGEAAESGGGMARSRQRPEAAAGPVWPPSVSSHVKCGCFARISARCGSTGLTAALPPYGK